MKPARFDYHRAESVDQAVQLLSEFGDDAKILAGGQSLVPTMNFRLVRPAVLIDVNPITDLDYVAEGNSTLGIGALARHFRFEQPVVVGPLGDLLQSAARFVGHLPIRIRGTFGGSIAHADPAAEWCVIAATLDAEMVARSGSGERVVAANDFFVTTFTTALQPDELLTEVRLPALGDDSRTGFAEFSRRAGDFALVMAATAIRVGDGQITEARIGLGGVRDKPVRAPQAEASLAGMEPGDDAAAQAGAAAAEEIDPLGDIHGSPEYRRDLVEVMTRRALQSAMNG